MAQVLLLKIGFDGVSQEFDSANDDITLNSFTVQGGGPVLSPTGLDMNSQAISDSGNLSFNDPSVNTIVQTGGGVVVDDFMAVSLENSMDLGAAILFPSITDNADQVDAFRLPAIAGVPTATPADGGEGYQVWDSTNDALYVWNGAAWVNVTDETKAQRLCNLYTAGETIAAGEVVYISAANTVSLADASVDAEARVVGFAENSAAAAASVEICSDGVIGGLTGLTAGSPYYLAATPGGFSATVPTGSGNNIVLLGYAKSTTEMHLQITRLGRRA